eukprot:scaffold177_cov334-Pavlova_lutheri.AAC.99
MGRRTGSKRKTDSKEWGSRGREPQRIASSSPPGWTRCHLGSIEETTILPPGSGVRDSALFSLATGPDKCVPAPFSWTSPNYVSREWRANPSPPGDPSSQTRTPELRTRCVGPSRCPFPFQRKRGGEAGSPRNRRGAQAEAKAGKKGEKRTGMGTAAQTWIWGRTGQTQPTP